MGVFLRIFAIVFVSLLFLRIIYRLTRHYPRGCWGCSMFISRLLYPICERIRFIGLPRTALGWSLWIFVIWRCVKHLSLIHI